ncbi:hypothetical protein [Citrobacter amalonaticus]|uniref:hypothetical protein n=1 Tax=Citrobacter amalonaticus TaxID=35703 RepID=UPI002156521C|nr:hypothetical protein [Citrobacter amalonaticus]
MSPEYQDLVNSATSNVKVPLVSAAQLTNADGDQYRGVVSLMLTQATTTEGGA